MEWSPVISGAVAALGALAGSWMGSRSSRGAAVKAETTAKREEAMRLLRWATDLALQKGDPTQSRVGVEVLKELVRSGQLTPTDKAVVVGVLKTILAPSLAAYAEGKTEVKEVPDVRPAGESD